MSVGGNLDITTDATAYRGDNGGISNNGNLIIDGGLTISTNASGDTAIYNRGDGVLVVNGKTKISANGNSSGSIYVSSGKVTFNDDVETNAGLYIIKDANKDANVFVNKSIKVNGINNGGNLYANTVDVVGKYFTGKNWEYSFITNKSTDKNVLPKIVIYDKMKTPKLSNYGIVEINGTGEFGTLENIEGRVEGNYIESQDISNSGTIKANYIETGSYVDKSEKANADIYELNVGEYEFSLLGNTKVENINVLPVRWGVNSIPHDITSGKSLKINETGKGTVKIDRNITVIDGGELFLNLSNEDSYFSGIINSVDKTNSNIDLCIQNGAKWNIPSGDSINYGTVHLLSGGIINIDSTYADFTLNRLSGNNGVFNFKIHGYSYTDSEKNSILNIDHGMVHIIKNETENAKHKINLDATGANFLLTNNTKVTPFTLVEDQSLKNGGYDVKFTIDPFDAGTYNYTPTLKSEQDNSKVNYWTVTDIKPTGESPGSDEPDPNPPDNPPVNPVELEIIDETVTESGTYSTNNQLEAGINVANGDTATIKVDKADNPALVINAIDDDEDRTAGVVGNVNFTGGGTVKIDVSSEDNNNAYTAGIGTLTGDVDTTDGTKNISATQKVDIDVKSYNDTYGIYSTPTYEGADGAELVNEYNFDKELTVKAENLGNGKAVGIVSTDEFNVGGKSDITVKTGSGGQGIGVENSGEMNFKDGLTINGDTPGGEFTAISNHATENGDKPEIIIAKDLVITQKGTGVTSPEGIIDNGADATLNVKGDIKVTTDGDMVAIDNAGTLLAQNISLGKSDLVNSGELTAGKNVTADKFTNSGEAEIKGTGQFTDLVNEGQLNAKNIEVDTFGGANEDATATVENLKINKMLKTDGSLDAHNFTIGQDSNESVSFGEYLLINDKGGGKVNIDRDIKVGSGQKLRLKLDNADSHFAGKIDGVSDADIDFSLTNRATWDVQPYTQQLYGNTTFGDGAIINVPIQAGVTIDNLSGTGAIFNFDIEQASKGSGDIDAGTIHVTKNNTEGAKHTINLNPVQADFVLTNDTQVTPFTLVEDASLNNDGYALNFAINKFDAGVYNYTPTLESVKNSDNVALWQVTDIAVSGTTPTPPPSNPLTPSGGGGSGGNTPSTPTPSDNAPNGNQPSTDNPGNKPANNTPTPTPTPSNGGSSNTAQPNNNADTQQTATGDSDTTNPTPNENSADSNGGAQNSPSPSTTPSNESSTQPSQPVLSNLTYNVKDTAIHNFYHWRNEYNNLQKRLGDLHSGLGENGIWARMYKGEQEGKDGSDGQYNAIQVGYDRKFAQPDGDSWYFGGAVSSYNGSTQFAHQGNTEDSSISLALYATYMGDKGHYLDLIARHGRLKSDITSYAAGTGDKITGKMRSWGTSLSAEYGRRIDIGNNYYFQPEVELIYGHVSGGGYDLSDGSHASQSAVNSWTLRGGLRLGRQIDKNNYYLSLNYLRDFGGNSDFSITDKYGKSYGESTNLNDSRLEIGIGGNFQVNERTQVYAEIEKSFGGNVNTKWQGNIGVRWSF